MMISARELVLAFAAIAVATLLAWVFILLAASEPIPSLVHSVYDDKLDELDRRAIESAYVSQVEHLFEVWMKDPGGQPRRAVIGIRKARKAFIDAQLEIDRRR